MDLANYREKMDFLINNSEAIKEDDIFFFDDSPYIHDFYQVFEFYQGMLDRDKKLELAPAVLFFRNDRRVNAAAASSNGINVISLNMGLIVALSQIFKEKLEIDFLSAQVDYVKVIDRLDNDLSVLMYQMCTHFSFYHELGHIVQRSNICTEKVDESKLKGGTFTPYRHLLELDADEFSGVLLTNHMLLFQSKKFGERPKKEEVELLLFTTCGAILLYLMTWKSNQVPVYFEENSHPHPLIRMMWLVYSITEYYGAMLKLKGSDIELDSRGIVDKALWLCHCCSESIGLQDPVNRLIIDLRDHRSDLMEYIKKYYQLKVNDDRLAYQKYWLIDG